MNRKELKRQILAAVYELFCDPIQKHLTYALITANVAKACKMDLFLTPLLFAIAIIFGCIWIVKWAMDIYSTNTTRYKKGEVPGIKELELYRAQQLPINQEL